MSTSLLLLRLKVGQQILILFMLVRVQQEHPFERFIMIYRYTISGKVHKSDRTISQSASIPLGLSVDDLMSKVTAFSKAFDLTKLEVN